MITIEQRESFSQIRGANYVASYAATSFEMWNKYDHHQVQFELSLAKSIGMNGLRVWLNSAAYFCDPPTFLSNFEALLTACHECDIRVVPILFDSCGAEPLEGPYRLTRANHRFSQFEKEPYYSAEVRRTWSDRLRKYVSTVAPDVRCLESANATALLWETWTPDPGYAQLVDRTAHEKLFEYVDALVDTFHDDKRILAWDIMNEPWVTEIFLEHFDDPVPGEFAQIMCEHVSARNCGVPITVGAGTLERALRLRDCVDVLSFHCYETDDALSAELKRAKSTVDTEEKPVLLTECLATAYSDDLDVFTDHGQQSLYRSDLPRIIDSGIGFFQFGLMVGRAPFSHAGLFYPNGVRRPSAIWLADQATRLSSLSSAEVNN